MPSSSFWQSWPLRPILNQERLILFLATGAGAGYLRWAPGTWGAVIAIPFSLALNRIALFSLPLAVLTLIGFALCAGWLCDRAEGILQEKDSPRIVVDEIAGFLLANFLSAEEIPPLAAAFILFRFFDIIKPFPAARMEKLPGGAGVVGDDLIAGCYALVAVRLLVFWGLL